MLTTRKLTPYELELNKIYESADFILVLKDFTIIFGGGGGTNKLHLIKKGQKSLEYQWCNYNFLDENNILCPVNSAVVTANPDYFKPITLKEWRKLKLEKICEVQDEKQNPI